MAIEVQLGTEGVRAKIRPPGSKSLTNRAMVIAALAQGRSVLRGVLASQDTEVMFEALEQLGIPVYWRKDDCEIELEGCGGSPPARSAALNLKNSGTSIRFLTALCCLGQGEFRLDGVARMRERPIGDLVAALNALGGNVEYLAKGGYPPVIIRANGLAGGLTDVAGTKSSQFLSALLMAAPLAQSTVTLAVAGTLVSQPYVRMTLDIMQAFGVSTEVQSDRYAIRPQSYMGREFQIEPDASAASYFFAAAALLGGEVTVEGLSRNAVQGDIAFVDILEKMGCEVRSGESSVTVIGRPLAGVDVDMNGISDTVQTLAAIAPFASSPTRIRNVAHVRFKETDRLAAVCNELKRIGIRVEEHDDGIVIYPGQPRSATVQTYDDHRMAMSFSLVGLRVPGIFIADPECTAKTYPNFFADLRVFQVR